MLILDTNVVSELMRPQPDVSVRRWIDRHPPESLFLTVVTQAEILLGIALMADGRRKTNFMARAEEMFAIDFADRILAFNSAEAFVYAHLVAYRRRAGRPISPLDAEIAAITLAAEAALVTRNIRDFEGLGMDLHDPWES